MSSKFNPLQTIRHIFHSGETQGEKDNPHSFNTRREKEEAYESIKRGTSMVPLTRIVGSVGRYHDFDNQFKTDSLKIDDRLKSILSAMKAGKSMPPVSLYQIKDDYFILDGHHRFQAAQKLGYSQILSHIVELLPSKDTLENRLYREKTEFRDKGALPERIDLTEPGQFHHLEKQIKDHRAFLIQEGAAEGADYQSAAGDWYDTIYRPLTRVISESNLVRSFPGRTVDDLYLYISTHQWEKGKKRKYGIGVDRLIPKDMEKFREKMAQHKKQQYPEMRRKVTVFILLNVDGRHEQRIFDKLLTLSEVEEVHSVHGSIDLIVKVTLVRDLLSSDGELLAEFMLTTIRKWPGVISTQTLIPGVSKIKGEDRCLI